MKKQFISLSLTLILAAGITAPRAMQITFSATLQQASCEIVPSASSISVPAVDTGHLQGLNDRGPVSPFSLSLRKCHGTIAAVGKHAFAKITGPTLNGQPTMFNKNPEDATHAGIFIATAKASSIPLRDGDNSARFSVKVIGGDVDLVAGLIAAGPTTGGTVIAPIDFTFDLH